MSALAPVHTPKDLFSHRKYWAARFGTAPFLPMSRAEMDKLGWEECDIILVTGDAYVDHPSFGMAIIGRLLEAQGFRVGIIAQPDWHSVEPFRALGRPKLFFGITAGNMDSMVNRYTSDRRVRSDDAYTPNAEPEKRPDRSVIVYSQRAREAYSGVPIVIGGIEASLRRIAHFDYWSEKVRRSVLVDAKADLLVYGNAERAIVEIAHRLAARQSPADITDIRGTHRHARPAESAGGSLCDGRCDAESQSGSRSVRAGAGCAGGEIHPRGEKRRPRTQRDPHARLREGGGRSGALRPCFAHPACRVQSRQCTGAGAAPR
jgi:hypothetical protein